MRGACAILLAVLASALIGCGPAAPEPKPAPEPPKYPEVFVNPLDQPAPTPAPGTGLPKYRGVFVYPWQHSRAREAAGCHTEVAFAKVVSTDLKENYGANTVVIAGQQEAPAAQAGTGNYEQIVRAYVAEGMYVVLYVQGEFFYRGATGEKWTDADAEKFIAGYLAYLHRFDDLGDKVLMTIDTEEIHMWDTRDGKPIPQVVSPRLKQILKATKKGSRWPVGVILNGYRPYCLPFAALADDERPDVYLVETYAPLFVDGASWNGTPTQAQIMSGKYDVAPLIEAARQQLQTAEEIFAGKCEVAHQPLIGGIPVENLTGKGWEYTMVPGYYRPQVKLYDGKYQLGWLHVTPNQPREGLCVGLRDQEFKLTPIGKELLGCWKEENKPAASGK